MALGREVKFVPFGRRDVALLHEDGWYLDNIPRKIAGPEKVAQMCAIILVHRIRFHEDLVRVTDYDAIPLIVGSAVAKLKEMFENTGAPDENLKDVKIERIWLNPENKSLHIRLQVYTQAGEYTPLHLRLPYLP